MVLLAVTLLAGCFRSVVQTESPVSTSPSVAPSPKAAVEPQTAATVTHGDTITLTDGSPAENTVSVPEAEPGIPDELPPELQDVAALNEYAVTLWMNYIKPDIFETDLFSEAEKAIARKALKLIIAAEDKAIALYDKNEHLYYQRGIAYVQCFYDINSTDCMEKALADLRKAADMGLTAAQKEYDSLADMLRLLESEDTQGYVRAWVEDGNASLTLDETFWLEYLGVDITRDVYHVEGLGGACVGVYVDTLGWRIAPFILFLMEDGTVEYLDVEDALLQSADPGDTFTSMGALMGLSGIVDFIPGLCGDAEEYDGVYAADNKTVFAIDSSGRRFDVFSAYAAENLVYD
jgi:hypothetical protein